MKTRCLPLSVLLTVFISGFASLNLSAEDVGCYNDYTPPVAICDAHTVVSLTSDGKATLYATTLDDGSYDNCAIAAYKVARMNPGWCPYGVIDDTQFRSYTQFCCEDIGGPIWVILRVIDQAGNYNDCMVEVTVQDKLPPSIHCPYDKSVSCDYWFNPEELYNPNSTVFGSASAYDNCGLEYIYVDVIDNTSCNLGHIKRVFTAVDWGGKSSQCIQNVWITDNDPFNKYDIYWPKDYEANGCSTQDYDPSDLPNGYNRPTWNDNNCSLIGAAYDDLVFHFVEGVCTKVLRTWTVIDWCQFDPYNPYSNGIWTHIQIIKLIDHDKPMFENCKDTTVAGLENTCAGHVVLNPWVWDYCTPKDKLDYEYKVDIHSNGTMDIIRKDKPILDEILPVGTHKVLWFVDDGCGNLGTCSFYVTVYDGKAPTPVCYAQLSTVVMPAGGMVTLWAKDFDASSFDNCTPRDKLKFSFKKNQNAASQNFNCDFVGTNQIKVYVTDLAGNQAYCNVQLTIGDNENVCEGMHPLQGEVTSFSGTPISQAAVGLYMVMSDETMDMDKEEATDLNGHYQTGFGTTDYDRALEVTKTGMPLEGISTLDLTILQQHILGIKLITDPVALYAADVDGSGTVGVNDLLMLRDAFLSNGRSLLGKDLPWLFYPAQCSWEEVGVVDGCEPVVQIDKTNPPQGPIDFLGVKKGDINGEVLTELTGEKSQGGLSIELNVTQSGAQGTTISAVAMNDLNISGLQISMLSGLFNNNGAAVLYAGQLPIRENSYTIESNDRSLNIAWTSLADRQIQRGDELFTIVLPGGMTGDIRKLVNLEGMYQDQVITSDLKASLLELHWGRIMQSGDITSSPGADIGSVAGNSGDAMIFGRSGAGVEAGLPEISEIRVWPNPTSGDAVLSYVSEAAGNGTFELYSSDLKQVFTRTINSVKGSNQFEINSDAFTAGPGLYYYRITGKGQPHTGKVVFIE